MEQDVRFCELDGKRIAYATVGEGPLLLFSGRWVTHLEEEWEEPNARSFFEELARAHRVVRYDARGTGRSTHAARTRSATGAVASTRSMRMPRSWWNIPAR